MRIARPTTGSPILIVLSSIFSNLQPPATPYPRYGLSGARECPCRLNTRVRIGARVSPILTCLAEQSVQAYNLSNSQNVQAYNLANSQNVQAYNLSNCQSVQAYNLANRAERAGL